MSVLTEPVLVLNKNWVPIDTWTVRRAFKALFAGTAKFLDTSDEHLTLHEFETWVKLPVQEGHPFIETWNSAIPAPEVIVLMAGINSKRRHVMTFSRRHLAKRDHHTCQYCGQQKVGEEMTIDHVHPRSLGGKSSWTNCVLACWDCNSQKGDKTLEQVGKEYGMKLLSKPYEPGWSPIYRVPANKYKESWKHFVGNFISN